jgi:hemerythrin
MTKALRIELPEELTAELLTGIDEIDCQHAYFLSLVRASSALGDRSDGVKAQTLILEIVRYAQSHFAFEETMMKVYDYPNLVEHVGEHAKILETITTAMASDPINIAKFRLELLRWFSSHISLDDMQLAEFVRKNRPSLGALSTGPMC